MSTAVPLKVTPPAQGAKIIIRDGKLIVPDNPIIPFIEGDGTGPDIWRASVRVMDAAVQKTYGGRRKIHWMEVYAGEKSNKLFNTWLPAASTSYPSRDRSRLQSAGASARSTWLCGKCWICTCACGRCAGSRVSPPR